MILQSSDPKGGCFVETKGLDGETNLKLKSVQRDIKEAFEHDSITSMNGHIVCERPNTAIYKYEGYLQLGPNDEKISLNTDYVLLRGMSLRNTEHVYGVVVFTGHDTKVMKNSSSGKYKFSSLEKLTNKSIYIIFLI